MSGPLPDSIRCALFLAILAWCGPAVAQGTGSAPPAPPTPPPGTPTTPPTGTQTQSAGEGLTVRDSNVGYIDTALTGNLFRFRADSSYDFNRPSRAEFLYARTGPAGPGLPTPEKKIDAQELTAYLQFAITPEVAGFIEAPWVFINPQINANANGFGDLRFGGKWAFIYTPDLVASFQLRTFVPTGDAGKGLGTHHVSLEPAFLFYRPLGESLVLEGELRQWIPVGGTNFSAPVIRCGLGLDYLWVRSERWRLTPVAELVGWTVLGGKEAVVPLSGPPFVEAAAGNTILNAKFGLRVGLGRGMDLYAGYGTALTGTHWYTDTFRLELRLAF